MAFIPPSAIQASPPAIDQSGVTRVLIVDDSAVARALIARQIEPHARFRVVGAVSHVEAALAFLGEQSADIILLDVAMPGMDGITALPRLIAAGAGARIIIVSASTPAGGAAAVQALAHGAADTLDKPRPQGLAEFGDALLQKLDGLAHSAAPAAPTPVPPVGRARGPVQSALPEVIGIGASTGGIHALAKLLARIPATMTVPIVVTQHLPATFIPFFAAQLTAVAGRPSVMAEDRMRVRPGQILVAPGDAHVTFVRLTDGSAAIRLKHERARSGCLPSVDPMFASMADLWGGRAWGIVLTGMGRDGLEGARMLKAAGATIIAQDRESAVVWGMPGAVVTDGLADAVMAPDAIGAMIAAGGLC
ncbi:chemotaxis-specific protein-glutamate methyltransferase CheB [Sphingomonas sanguinis]|uniref:chemotaxis-specific protein-glutamate methyltransferase CheB n=1 Tax=Sphingomonas sanguinis TaxID=33051 RepID=UPI001C5A311F|nr:chemotaxis-specific protein-glutamate methyltransferase CheB [Sphingomonas sanguinis]QXT36657.1 chemotaxis-specific protein-glutamate methyltransferase CheB [Sphingomonas sanguinis]